MTDLTVFNFESHEIRFVEGKPIGNDIASVLGYVDPSKTVSTKVSKKNKGVTKTVTPGGIQSVTVLEEAGIYQLIFGSKLESAEKFQDWVFSEVLPSIRKTGSYNAVSQLRHQQPSDNSAKINQLTTKKASIQEEIKQLEDSLATKKRELQEVSESLVIEAKAYYDASPETFKQVIACKEILDHAKQRNPYRSLPSV
ncbi:BRO-N domain-containing protein [Nostoc sp. DSM 114167]|jgi:prophage antirepressor-like protein|uniref:BRO-N domain-containing protein n=1 Tax=Nostoc sp. DSM 114167 TaxID=3439050 RepID=UPI0040460664